MKSNRSENRTIKKAEQQRLDAFYLWCWRRLLRIPWTSKEIKSVNLKGNQPWIFFGRTDVEAEAPIFWPPNVKSWLTEKDPDAGKDWGQEEKGTTENEMTGWHDWLNGHKFEQTVGDSEDGEAWCAAVHGVAKNWVCLSYWGGEKTKQSIINEFQWREDQQISKYDHDSPVTQCASFRCVQLFVEP